MYGSAPLTSYTRRFHILSPSFFFTCLSLSISFVSVSVSVSVSVLAILILLHPARIFHVNISPLIFSFDFSLSCKKKI